MPEEADRESPAPAFVDRYPSMGAAPQQWRSRKANGRAALALIAGLVLIVMLLAIFA